MTTLRSSLGRGVLLVGRALVFVTVLGAASWGMSAAAWSSPPVQPVSRAGSEDGRAWPVGSRPAVLRGWEPPDSAYGPGHRGVDLAAAGGAPVRAAAAGRISFAGKVAGRGVLSISLSGTGAPPLRTTYEPVDPLVDEGAEVTAGQVVATLASGPFHCPVGCLHWGLLRGRTYLDPLSLLPPRLLSRGPSRLLPVFGIPEPSTGAGSTPAPRAPSRPSTASTTADGLYAALLLAAAVSVHRARPRAHRGVPGPGRAAAAFGGLARNAAVPAAGGGRCHHGSGTRRLGPVRPG